MNGITLIDIAGWAGVLLLLAAYGLVSTGRTEGDSVPYQTLNLIGGALLIINSFHFGAYPSVGINVAWVGIGIYALVRRGMKQKRVQEER